MFVGSNIFAGESYVKKEFNLKANAQSVSQWMKDNPNAVAESTGCTIVSRKNEIVRLSQDTPKGFMDFTSKESFTETKSSYNYDLKLEKVHEGTLVNQSTSVKIDRITDNSCKVSIYMMASVSNAGNAAIRSDLARSVRGLQDLLESNCK